MYKAIDIARKILGRATDEDSGELVSNLKLQKLLYYMQGYHLAFFDTPLFGDPIEAWMYGPVVPSVFDAFKGYGRAGIEYTGGTVTLSDEEESLFSRVYDIYSRYSAYGLMELTHYEEPWKSTPAGRGNVIPLAVIRDFFKTKVEP